MARHDELASALGLAGPDRERFGTVLSSIEEHAKRNDHDTELRRREAEADLEKHMQRLRAMASKAFGGGFGEDAKGLAHELLIAPDGTRKHDRDSLETLAKAIKELRSSHADDVERAAIQGEGEA